MGASSVLEKAQAQAWQRLRDVLMSHRPGAGRFWGRLWVPPRHAHTDTDPTLRVCLGASPVGLVCSHPPSPSPPWDAVLGTGDLAGSCLYFWH